MGIVNAQQVEADKYELLDKELLEFVEDVLLNRSQPAVERSDRPSHHLEFLKMRTHTTCVVCIECMLSCIVTRDKALSAC